MSLADLPMPMRFPVCPAEHYVPFPSDRNLPCVNADVHGRHRDSLGNEWVDADVCAECLAKLEEHCSNCGECDCEGWCDDCGDYRCKPECTCDDWEVGKE